MTMKPEDKETPLATRREFVAAVGVAAGAAVLGGSGGSAQAATLPILRIHPAIGVARLGNADPSTYFIGPEIPGYPATGEAPGSSVPPYKVNGLVKPQAARFRIYEYAYQGGKLTPVREINLDTPGIQAISWHAHLANRKSSFHEENGPSGESRPPEALRNASVTDRRSLESDFGPRSISGRGQGPVEFRHGTSANPAAESVVRGADGNPVIDYLGQLRTDAAGRLIAIAGRGRSGCDTATPAPLTHWANNDHWFDDISDGPITATVTLSDGTQVSMDAAGHAWLLTGPPDFAPRIAPAVSLYDLLFDMAVRQRALLPANHSFYESGGPLHRLRQLADAFRGGEEVEFPGITPDFATEVLPVLDNAYRFRWVSPIVSAKHATLINPSLGDPNGRYDQARVRAFSYIRAPAGALAGTGPRSMPRLLGDNPYQGDSLTTGGDGGTATAVPDHIRRLTLTRTQFGLLRRWASGVFTPSTPSLPPPQITPHGLDRAALENCSGGAFFPGIECGWQIRNSALFIEPFRLNHAATSQYLGEAGRPLAAGHFSRQMAIPWQADFSDCTTEGNFDWWPAQRPSSAFLDASAQKPVSWARPDDRFAGGNVVCTYDDMIANWWKFGFIVQQWGGAFIETERAPAVP
jgi:hypothetical protein